MHRLLILIMLAVVGVFCCVWQHVQVIQLGRVMVDMQTISEELQFKKRALELKEASLSSLERIERISRNDLGLIKGKPAQTLYVSSLAEKMLISEHLMTEHQAKGMATLLPSFTTMAKASMDQSSRNA